MRKDIRKLPVFAGPAKRGLQTDPALLPTTCLQLPIELRGERRLVKKMILKRVLGNADVSFPLPSCRFR